MHLSKVRFQLIPISVICKHDRQVDSTRVDLSAEIMHHVGVHRYPGKGDTRTVEKEDKDGDYGKN
jgi:hypothetical protein